jgi:hypothetical protein
MFSLIIVRHVYAISYTANGPIPTIVLLTRNQRISGFEKWILVCLELDRADRCEAWNSLMQKLMTTEMPESEFVAKALELDFESMTTTKKRLQLLDLQSKTKGNQVAESQIERIPDVLKKFLEEIDRGEQGAFNRTSYFRLQYKAYREPRP